VFTTESGTWLWRSTFTRRILRPATDGNPNAADPTVRTKPVSPGLTFHGLRHSHNTWMITDDIPDIARARRLGHHTDNRLAEIYSHVSGELHHRILTTLQHRWHTALQHNPSTPSAPHQAAQPTRHDHSHPTDDSPSTIDTKLVSARTTDPGNHAHDHTATLPTAPPPRQGPTRRATPHQPTHPTPEATPPRERTTPSTGQQDHAPKHTIINRTISLTDWRDRTRVSNDPNTINDKIRNRQIVTTLPTAG
jgi:hypothetical protein